ncbi:MAG TPA: hypothetical protein VE398_02015 [Acidobacteriota bacterium]|nr:hypothetical protein [Acidobacteriota bacterium]
MTAIKKCLLALVVALFAGDTSRAQIYSPKVLLQGQIDASDLEALAKGIFVKAGAATPRQKAEAIWRFFLTDGRYVKPGFWYHIAGWAYEEPQGEVLEPLKLLNSYGFGLCYQIAPVLEAVFVAGGFEDARVWFLTGHTVAEVYYEGAYHHFDSDMMGYSTLGSGNPKNLPVASVSQIAHDGSIILGKLKTPTEVDGSKVDYPWYPADVREAAIGGLAELFTTTGDNWLFPYNRAPQGHSMAFVLRPGERLIRFYRPESEGLFYLPFQYGGGDWTEFPKEIAQYKIRTAAGPRSQKDNRLWSTGRLEYTPALWDRAAYYPLFAPGFNTNLSLPDAGAERDYLGRLNASQPSQAVFEMRCPYVLIDARVTLDAFLEDQAQTLQAEISSDGARSWAVMDTLRGPYRGKWSAEPVAIKRSQHGTLTAVSGKYSYLVRLSMRGAGAAEAIQLRNIGIVSRFQLNPRTLPELAKGRNNLSYRAGPATERREIPFPLERLTEIAAGATNVRCVIENGQAVLWPDKEQPAEFLLEIAAPDGTTLSGFDAGARFLDLRDGLAPEKTTAEVRSTHLGFARSAGTPAPSASLAWSTSPPYGGYTSLWEYSPEIPWKDGKAVKQLLRWPEVDRKVRDLPQGIRKVYVRYRLNGMGLDSLRLAAISPGAHRPGTLEITHQWLADGQVKTHVERIERHWLDHDYVVDTGSADNIVNQSLILSCPIR